MKSEVVLCIVFGVFGILNIYCFQFQRTTQKIRSFAVGTTIMELEKFLLPVWYYWLYYISFIRFIPLIWLFILNWKYAVIILIVMFILKLVIPVDDYNNIQKIKRHFEARINSNSMTNLDLKLYEIVLESEKKTF